MQSCHPSLSVSPICGLASAPSPRFPCSERLLPSFTTLASVIRASRKSQADDSTLQPTWHTKQLPASYQRACIFSVLALLTPHSSNPKPPASLFSSNISTTACLFNSRTLVFRARTLTSPADGAIYDRRQPLLSLSLRHPEHWTDHPQQGKQASLKPARLISNSCN